MNNDIVDINDIINSNEEIVPIDELFEDNKEINIEKEIKNKRVERIQIGLIVFLIVFASIVYFFGYDYVKPFIKID